MHEKTFAAVTFVVVYRCVAFPRRCVAAYILGNRCVALYLERTVVSLLLAGYAYANTVTCMRSRP